jgi:hypothetical protein
MGWLGQIVVVVLNMSALRVFDRRVTLYTPIYVRKHHLPVLESLTLKGVCPDSKVVAETRTEALLVAHETVDSVLVDPDPFR